MGETKNQKQNLRDADGDLVLSHKPPAREKKRQRPWIAMELPKKK
jgi:hypothetical protein